MGNVIRTIIYSLIPSVMQHRSCQRVYKIYMRLIKKEICFTGILYLLPKPFDQAV